MSRTMNWVCVTCGTLTEKNSNSWGKEDLLKNMARINPLCKHDYKNVDIVKEQGCCILDCHFLTVIKLKMQQGNFKL